MYAKTSTRVFKSENADQNLKKHRWFRENFK